jgi:ribulose-phosphate 3-epimerase
MIIKPAILTENLDDFEEKLEKIKDIFSAVQIDFCDGEFTQSKTILPADLQFLDLSLEIEAHLMVSSPQDYLEDLAKIKTQTVFFHVEAVSDPLQIIGAIKIKGMRPGLALSPSTPTSKLLPFLPLIDKVLILTVEPGFGGQKLQEDVLIKIEEVKKGFAGFVAVDGGVNLENIQRVKDAGADEAIIGSGLFQDSNFNQTLEKLEEIANG